MAENKPKQDKVKYQNNASTYKQSYPEVYELNNHAIVTEFHVGERFLFPFLCFILSQPVRLKTYR